MMKKHSLPRLVSNMLHAASSMLHDPRSTILAVLLCAPIATLAGVPQVISYQGRINLAGGAPPSKGTYVIQARIYNNATGGTVLWGETYPVSVNVLGIFNVSLGSGGAALTPAPTYATLAPAMDGGPRYLGITVVATPAGWVNSSQEMSPRIQLLSSPYAMRTAMADVANTFQGTPPAAFAVMPVQPQQPNFSSVLAYSGTNLAASSLGWNIASNAVVANQSLVAASVLSMGSLSGQITGPATNGLALGTNVNSITIASFTTPLGTTTGMPAGTACFTNTSTGSFTNTSDSLVMFFWQTANPSTTLNSTITLHFSNGQTNTVPFASQDGSNTSGFVTWPTSYTLLPVPAGTVVSWNMAGPQTMTGILNCKLWQ